MQLPMAKGSIVLATNQGLLYVLAMVVIGGLVGAGALGYDTVLGFSRSEEWGKGAAAGITIVLLGIMIDRIAKAASERSGPMSKPVAIDKRQWWRPVGSGGVDPDSLRFVRRGKAAPPGDGSDRQRGAGEEMRRTGRKAGLLVAWVATATLALSACGSGGSIDEETKENAGRPARVTAASFNIAVNPWVGYEADAYVVGHVAETKLGCKVNYKELKEDVSWQGFGTGEVDVVLEDWGHPDLEKKFFAEHR